MPIYEYECKSCGHHLEILQKITEKDLIKCPDCGKDTLSKLISATTFQLKGTGWYATDFRDKGKAKPSETNETSDTKTTAKETKDTNKTATPQVDKAKTSQTSKDSKGE